jgi:hypothetical protein
MKARKSLARSESQWPRSTKSKNRNCTRRYTHIDIHRHAHTYTNTHRTHTRTHRTHADLDAQGLQNLDGALAGATEGAHHQRSGRGPPLTNTPVRMAVRTEHTRCRVRCGSKQNAGRGVGGSKRKLQCKRVLRMENLTEHTECSVRHGSQQTRRSKRHQYIALRAAVSYVEK